MLVGRHMKRSLRAFSTGSDGGIGSNPDLALVHSALDVGHDDKVYKFFNWWSTSGVLIQE